MEASGPRFDSSMSSMQPPDRNSSAPDPNSSPIPPVFEDAPAPNPLVPPPVPEISAGDPPVYSPASESTAWLAPIPPPHPSPVVAEHVLHRVTRWRWAMSLLLIGFYPVFLTLLGKLRGGRATTGSALPSSVRGLLIVSAFELGIFAIFWVLGWAFSRATKDELMLRWRGGIWPILQGLGYALALRLGLVLVIIFLAGIILTATGIDPKQFSQFMQKNQPNTDALFAPSALSNPLYLFTMMTVLSFVVAGLREELWRTASLAALRHLLPDDWSERTRWIWAIALSSVVFGLGHLYQGGLGVFFTAILGAGLGAVTWRHRSIWPSVFAHGFIDATSFLAAALMAGKKLPVEVFWWWG